jgi:hypothetical protein
MRAFPFPASICSPINVTSTGFRVQQGGMKHANAHNYRAVPMNTMDTYSPSHSALAPPTWKDTWRE